MNNDLLKFEREDPFITVPTHRYVQPISNNDDNINDPEEEILDDQNLIDWEIFNDILSLDEDDPDFSKNLVLTFIAQAENTFKNMDLIFNKLFHQFFKKNSWTLPLAAGLERIKYGSRVVAQFRDSPLYTLEGRNLLR